MPTMMSPIATSPFSVCVNPRRPALRQRRPERPAKSSRHPAPEDQLVLSTSTSRRADSEFGPAHFARTDQLRHDAFGNIDRNRKTHPSRPPDGERICELIPIMRPCESSNGPPEFPGLIDASVWIAPSMGRSLRARIGRCNPLITPVVKCSIEAERVSNRQHFLSHFEPDRSRPAQSRSKARAVFQVI